MQWESIWSCNSACKNPQSCLTTHLRIIIQKGSTQISLLAEGIWGPFWRESSQANSEKFLTGEAKQTFDSFVLTPRTGKKDAENIQLKFVFNHGYFQKKLEDVKFWTTTSLYWEKPILYALIAFWLILISSKQRQEQHHISGKEFILWKETQRQHHPGGR